MNEENEKNCVKTTEQDGELQISVENCDSNIVLLVNGKRAAVVTKNENTDKKGQSGVEKRQTFKSRPRLGILAGRIKTTSKRPDSLHKKFFSAGPRIGSPLKD